MAGTAAYVIASQISFSGITFKQQDGVRRWRPRDVGRFSQATQLGSLSLFGFTSVPADLPCSASHPTAHGSSRGLQISGSFPLVWSLSSPAFLSVWNKPIRHLGLFWGKGTESVPPPLRVPTTHPTPPPVLQRGLGFLAVKIFTFAIRFAWNALPAGLSASLRGLP